MQDDVEADLSDNHVTESCYRIMIVSSNHYPSIVVDAL